jgi:cell division protein FtsW
MSAMRDRWVARDAPPDREPVRRQKIASPASRQATILADPGALKRVAHEPDYVILVAVVALASIGILMVYSASAIPSYANSQNSFQLLAPQIMAGLIGLAAMVFLMRLDYRYLRVAALPLAALALIMLLIVLVPIGPLKELSVTHNNSARWIHLGPLPDIAPAEIAKLALVVYLALWLDSKGTQIKSLLKGALPFAIIVVPFLLLVVREPDLGTGAVLLLIAFTLYFAAGAKLLHLIGAIAIGGPAAFLIMIDTGAYPVERIQCLLDPWSDPARTCYQAVKGLEAISAGGLFGVGLGNTRVSVPWDVNDSSSR